MLTDEVATDTNATSPPTAAALDKARAHDPRSRAELISGGLMVPLREQDSK